MIIMSHCLIQLFAFSISIPAAVAIVKVKQIDQIYLPFLLCIWIGFLNECVSYLMIDIFHVSNTVNANIYCLIEALLYTGFFKKLDFFINRKRYILLMGFLCIAWLIENFIVSGITLFDSFFTMMYSLIIVSMSITVINRLIMDQVNLLMNPVFLLCIAFIIYFSVLGLVEIFWLYGLTSSDSFRLNIYRIMAYINLFVNLIFAFAILWMHRKQEFIPQ
ncbi:MAG: hypothetical protein JWO92_1199 [Chitinophagaceae bacterium]|nr:hypothetical protein [Chitinophagaceae bacterium]